MITAAIVAAIVRYGMVMLFLPFSALDKILSFDHAVKQAQQVFSPMWLATVVLMAGLCVEVGCCGAIVLGIADRAAALIVAGYCAATAVLYKPFWRPGDFFADPDGKARGLFWDFLKNLSLGAGFLLLIVGTDGSGLQPFLAAPLASSHPYGR